MAVNAFNLNDPPLNLSFMNVPSSLARARAAFELQQFEVARRHALAAATENPGSIEPHLILGRICLHLGKWADARSHAGEILQLAPDFFAGYWLLGWGWLLDRDTDIPGNLTGSSRPRIEPARAAAKTAVSLAPDDEFNHLLSGAVEFEDGNAKAALNHIDTGLALNPSSSELLTWRGRALHAIGKLDVAEEAFLDSLKIRPEDPDTHFFLARLQTKRCKFRAALPHIREFMRLTPDSEEGAKLYWELIKTQHLLLRAVAWLDVKCQPIRRRPFWWIIGTMAVGLPLLIAVTPTGSKEPSAIGLLILAGIATLPFISETLPGLTDALWLWIGRDYEQPIQSSVDRITTVEIAVGMVSLPVAGLLTAIDKNSHAFFWVWSAICIAGLHNLGMRAVKTWIRALFYGTVVCFLLGMLRIAFLDGPPEEPNKWRMLYVVASVVGTLAVGYAAHRTGQIRT